MFRPAKSRAAATRLWIALPLMAALAACSSSDSSYYDDPNSSYNNPNNPANIDTQNTVWNLFGARRSEQTVKVNRYLWAASLDTLDFLPLDEVDPFTGVIVTGYGRPPGGGRAYRATVHISDPALEARSLRVALYTQNGPVSKATARAVEDAILSRARQMRIADSKY